MFALGESALCRVSPEVRACCSENSRLAVATTHSVAVWACEPRGGAAPVADAAWVLFCEGGDTAGGGYACFVALRLRCLAALRVGRSRSELCVWSLLDDARRAGAPFLFHRRGLAYTQDRQKRDQCVCVCVRACVCVARSALLMFVADGARAGGARRDGARRAARPTEPCALLNTHAPRVALWKL